MQRRFIVSLALAATLATGGCANMTPSQQSTLSGAAIGTGVGAIVGAATGEWAWAAGGAAVGAVGGYLYNQEKEKQQAAQNRAYQQGVAAGKAQAQ